MTAVRGFSCHKDFNLSRKLYGLHNLTVRAMSDSTSQSIKSKCVEALSNNSDFVVQMVS